MHKYLHIKGPRSSLIPASDLEKYILDFLVAVLLMPSYQQLQEFRVHKVGSMVEESAYSNPRVFHVYNNSRPGCVGTRL